MPELPFEVLPYLMSSRYCEVDRLSEIAWSLFGHTPTGWARVQAVCDWVHTHFRFGIPPQPVPMDFSAWFEVYLDHQWYTFDARHNTPRIGRILMTRGKDAVDTALTTAFGEVNLTWFTVWTSEVSVAQAPYSWTK